MQIDVDEVEGDIVQARIITRQGTLDVLGSVKMVGRTLVVTNLHVQGLKPGMLGRTGMNEIARKVMEDVNADTLVIHGAIRTTGRNPGQRPRPVRFRR